jgi:hypothetical protein
MPAKHSFRLYNDNGVHHRRGQSGQPDQIRRSRLRTRTRFQDLRLNTSDCWRRTRFEPRRGNFGILSLLGSHLPRRFESSGTEFRLGHTPMRIRRLGEAQSPSAPSEKR